MFLPHFPNVRDGRTRLLHSTHCEFKMHWCIWLWRIPAVSDNILRPCLFVADLNGLITIPSVYSNWDYDYDYLENKIA